MRILFVHNGRERFVLEDLVLLRQAHQVTDWFCPGRLVDVLALVHEVRTHDLVFCWFASWHAFAPVLLARRLKKPALVVVGGYDTANVPAARYGSQRGGLTRWIARKVIADASHLIANSHAARDEAVKNAGADPGKISVIYHGVRPVPPGPLDRREAIVLTVGNVWRENLLRKGLLPFVRAARYLPEALFVLAGEWKDSSIRELRAAAGPNVRFTGFLADPDLAALYARASVYVQASLHEGFGLSVAEAMSAGCIPVVTRAGALPEVVGDAGILSDSADPLLLAAGIRQGTPRGSPVETARARPRAPLLWPREARRAAYPGCVGVRCRVGWRVPVERAQCKNGWKHMTECYKSDGLPFVSVIMPVRNEAAFIAAQPWALSSPRTIRMHRMEVLVADGMSNDGTRAVIARLRASRGHPGDRGGQPGPHRADWAERGACPRPGHGDRARGRPYCHHPRLRC